MRTPLTAPGLVEQRLGRREAREHIDSELLGLGTEDGHELAQRDDEVAVIGHLRRGDGSRVALAAAS